MNSLSLNNQSCFNNQQHFRIRHVMNKDLGIKLDSSLSCANCVSLDKIYLLESIPSPINGIRIAIAHSY